jgi:hypothetical protein
MANPVYNLPFRVDNNATNAALVLTLAPGQVTAFDAAIKINYDLFTPDASGVMISAVNFSGSQMNGTYAGAYPVELYSLATANGVTFNMTATGANTYVTTEHVGTFTLSAMSPWVSGNSINGTSDASELIDFSLIPAVCSLNIYFSTLNVTPSSITGFTATAQGDRTVVLAWVNPTGAGVSAAKIVYKMNGIPTTVSDGTVVTVLSPGTTKTISDLTSDSGEYYGFAAYTIDNDYQASTVSAKASAYPLWQPGERAWASHAEHMRMRNLGYI